MSHIIRLILCGILIYGSYNETGIFTAICFSCIFISAELELYLKERRKK